MMSIFLSSQAICQYSHRMFCVTQSMNRGTRAVGAAMNARDLWPRRPLLLLAGIYPCILSQPIHGHENVAVIKEGTPQPGHAFHLRAGRRRSNKESSPGALAGAKTRGPSTPVRATLTGVQNCSARQQPPTIIINREKARNLITPKSFFKTELTFPRHLTSGCSALGDQ